MLFLPAITTTLALLSGGQAAEQQAVIEVATRWRPPGLRIEVEADWLGETHVVPLTDDGADPADQPRDNVWAATLEGGRVRALPLRIAVAAQGLPRTVIAERLEPIVSTDARISFALEHDGRRPSARRVAIPAPPRAVQMNQVARLAMWAGWGAMAFLYVSWLVGRALDER